MKKNDFAPSVTELFSLTVDKVMKLADANSVLGEKIDRDGVTVIPVSKLSVGFAGGGADIEKGKNKHNIPSGAGAKVSLEPVSVLVIDGHEVRLLPVPKEEKPSPIAETVSAVVKQLKAKKKA